MTKICLHCIVTGRVQGVFYRSETQRQAKALKLTGCVKNLPSGEVEVLACGQSEQLEQLYQWLWKGPRSASVDQVTHQEKPCSKEYLDFVILY